MKLKIAYCVSHFPYQSETYLLNELKGLLDDGHDVTIFSTGQFKDFPKHGVVEEYKLLERTVYRPEIPRNRWARVYTALKLFLRNYRKGPFLLKTLNALKYGKYALNLQFFFDAVPFLAKQDFDVVHCQFGPNGIKALNFREIGLLRGAMITSLHGFDVNDKAFLSWPTHYSRKGLYKELAVACPVFTVSSNFTKQTVTELGISAHKIHVLPVGLDTEKFKPNNDKALLAQGPVILTVARLVEFKGLKYSIQAMAALVAEFPSLTYHIVGEGELRQELEAQIHTLGLAKHVFLHGALTQEQTLDLYQQAQIFVLSGIVASDGEVETQGLVIQEAQSMGLPVVVSDAGGIPEGLVSDVTGCIVPQKDTAAFVARLRDLCLNPDLRSQMGQAGRDFVIKNFDNSVHHRKLMALYQLAMQQTVSA